jgi:hypothetical protein
MYYFHKTDVADIRLGAKHKRLFLSEQPFVIVVYMQKNFRTSISNGLESPTQTDTRKNKRCKR